MMKKTVLFIAVLVCTAMGYAQDAVTGASSPVAETQNEYSEYYKDMAVEVQQAEVAQIPSLTVNVKDYGAVGDGVTLTTEALQKAIDDVAKRGGGHVVVPAGIWLFSSLEMKSGVDLHLEHNALLQQTFDKTKYKIQAGNKGRFYPGIYGENLHDISITGYGIIDGAGKYWRPVKRAKMSDYEWNRYTYMGGELQNDGMLWMPYNLKHVKNVTQSAKEEEALRSDLFRLTGCNRVLIKGVTFQNSPRFTVHPCLCKNVIVDGVSVRSMWNVQNTDGIDLSNCQKALVVNCYVDCGDDGICMKSGGGAQGLKEGPCQDILVQDCKVAHAHGGFVFGSDVAGGMNRILVRRCMFTNTDIGLRFKSALGRGGKTSNVVIQDIVMADINNEAILFNCGYFDNRYSASVSEKAEKKTPSTLRSSSAGLLGKNPNPSTLYAPDFQGILIERVTCREAKTAVFAKGIEGLNCVHDITIRNSTFFYREDATEIDEKTAQVKLENCQFKTFDYQRPTMSSESSTVHSFRVSGAKTTGANGQAGKTSVTMRSKANPSTVVVFDYAMNNGNQGAIKLNGETIKNVGNYLHDGYVYYNLTAIANDLYIDKMDSNFPLSDFIYN